VFIWLNVGSTMLKPPAQAASSLADFSTMKMEAIRSSETSLYTRSTRRHIPEDDILHSHRRENLKSYELNTRFRLSDNQLLKKDSAPIICTYTDYMHSRSHTRTHTGIYINDMVYRELINSTLVCCYTANMEQHGVGPTRVNHFLVMAEYNKQNARTIFPQKLR
jgi:hypothetical protein